MSSKEFAARLKAARAARGLTQQQLADKLASVQPEIAAMESGKRVVSLTTAVKLADVLLITVDWLAGRTAAGGPSDVQPSQRGRATP